MGGQVGGCVRAWVHVYMRGCVGVCAPVCARMLRGTLLARDRNACYRYRPRLRLPGPTPKGLAGDTIPEVSSSLAAAGPAGTQASKTPRPPDWRRVLVLRPAMAKTPRLLVDDKLVVVHAAAPGSRHT